jgi:hypothetical protein
MADYPQEDRRLDHKIDDIWRTLPVLRTDVADVKETVRKHDRLLYGYVDEVTGRQQPGISTMIVWIQQNLVRGAVVVISLLLLITFVPAEWRESILKGLFGIVFK